MNQQTDGDLIDPLTDQEQEIIDLMRVGLSNKEIARQMSLAYNTIKWYSKRIYAKLGVRNRNQLILKLQNRPAGGLNQLERAAPSPHLFSPPLTTFIGRQFEKEALIDLLRRERLVTLIGPGGIGKTRLAYEIFRIAPMRLDHQTTIMSVEASHSAEQLVNSLADLFKITLNIYDLPLNQVVAELPTSPLLLIIDNFETIIDGSEILLELLKHRPALKILVTSRSALKLSVEALFRLDGLQQQDEQVKTEGDASQLFRARAHLDPKTEQQPETDAAIEEICWLVGGSPLAIELAASWTRSLTCRQIVNELESGLEILTSDMRDVPARHRSMMAVCEQSWLSLKPAERRAALKLAVFENRFTWEAAREVGGIPLGVLTALLDHSILRRVARGRLSIHPALRRYLLAQQSRTKFDRHPIEQRFIGYFMGMLAALGEKLHSDQQITALNEIEFELDNMLRAWRLNLTHAEINLPPAAIKTLAIFFEIRDYSQQGSLLFEETLNILKPADIELYTGLQLYKGWHDIWLGKTIEGAREIFNALETLDAADLTGKWPLPISTLSFNEQFEPAVRQELEARYLAELARYEEQQDGWGAGWMAYGLGNITRPSGEFERSKGYFEQALERFQARQDHYGVTFALDGLSTTLNRMGDLDGAWSRALQLKAISLKMGNASHLTVSGEMFGMIKEKRGEIPKAFAAYREALEYASVNTNPTNIVPMLLHLGRLIAEHELMAPEVGVELLTLVRHHPYSQAGWFEFRKQECDRWLEQLRQKMEEEGYLAATVRGQQGTLVEGARRFLDGGQ
ncbi:MAG: LuxR C-terminal-related transcriptional regulator [Chloroflexota bacterium]